MAVLETIRVKLGVFITVIIALALLSFIVDPNTLQWACSSGNRVEVGKMNGNSISYEEYDAQVKDLTSTFERMTGQSLQGEQEQNFIRERVWRSLLIENVVIPAAQKAGITVGKVELDDLTKGDHAGYPKEYLAELLKAYNAGNPEAIKQWDSYKAEALSVQYLQKYASLLISANDLNSVAFANYISECNRTYTIELVSVPFNAFNTEIEVSDAEAKAYYNSHKASFVQGSSRGVKYIAFEAVPSESDVELAKERFAATLSTFAQLEVSASGNYAKINSDSSFDPETWYSAGDLNDIAPEVNNFVFSNNAGATSDIIVTKDALYAVKVLAVNATEGKRQAAIIEKSIELSTATYNECYAKANTIAAKAAGKLDKFEEAVKATDNTALQTYITETDRRLGNIEHTREVTRWVYEHGKGSVSNVITVDSKYYIVAAVTEVNKAGYTPYENVEAQIKMVLQMKKAGEAKVAEVTEQIAGLSTMQEIAAVLGTTVSTVNEMRFNNTVPQQLENPALVGAVAATEVGKIGKPIAANGTVSVFKVVAIQDDAFATEENIKNMNDMKTYQKLNVYNPQEMMNYNALIAILSKDKVSDYRPKYY